MCRSSVDPAPLMAVATPIRAVNRALGTGGRLLSRWAPRAVILVYHRVAPYTLDAELLCVSPENFAEHASVIARDYQPIPLAELAGELARGRVPDRTVVVTFDDGYVDNLELAKPLLAAAGIPASVFVATGSVGSSRRLWWVELERALLRARLTQPVLTLTIGERARSWPCRTQDQRRAAYGRIRAWLRTRSPTEIDAICDQLARWADESDPVTDPYAPRVMSPDELRELEGDGSIEVGAHTRTHVSLAAQDAGVQHDEILGSKLDLEEWLDRPVVGFSYPYGERWLDYGKRARSLVGRAGFRYAVRNYGGPVTRFTPDVHQLPRNLVRDWDGSEFARRLDHLFRR